MNPGPASHDLPALAPQVTPETREFWEAAAAGKLILKRCNNCGVVIWYPRAICPECHSTDTVWIDSAGRGAVYTFTVVRKADGPYAEATPYVLAYVELDEGPRVLTNVVDADPGRLQIGDRVAVTFHDTGQGSALPRFRPVG